MTSELTVSDIMEREVVSLKDEDSLDLADDIMRLGRIRHMPIVAGQRLVGILSQRDLFRAAISSVLQFKPGPQRDWLAKVRVREVMTTDVHTVNETTTVRDAVDLMLRHRVGCLPVVGGASEDTLIGLVSETDCLRLLHRQLAGGST
jgi:CBS domain-containing protein